MKPSRTYLMGLLAAVFLVFGASRPAFAIGVGDQAPDFEPDSTKGGKLKLSSMRGKTVLINFYNFDFSAT